MNPSSNMIVHLCNLMLGVLLYQTSTFVSPLIISTAFRNKRFHLYVPDANKRNFISRKYGTNYQSVMNAVFDDDGEISDESPLQKQGPIPTNSKKYNRMNIRQLFDEDSSTYTYILWDAETKDGILIDPVDAQVDRDISVAVDLGVNLIFGVNTHAHADHITGTYLLRQKINCMKSVISEASGASADMLLKSGSRIHFGKRFVEALATPGHTDGCMSFVTDDQSMVFTGDALLIQGCGRTDFQQGSSSRLYDSIHSQLFTLPDSCIVYPAHDYKGRYSSTIGEEKKSNPRLGLDKTRDEFIDIMANLNLPHPRKIDVAVPANLRDGQPVA